MAAFERLIHEMKASPPKAGVLIVLTAVGVYFWIPPIWNAIAGDDAIVSADQPGATGSEAPRSAEIVADSKPSQTLHWQELELIRKSDPLFRSASPSEIKADAFGVRQQTSPAPSKIVQQPVQPSPAEPASFAASDEEEERQAAQLQVAEVTRQLSLRSTMIGSSRRAAVINDGVYSEGDLLIVAGSRVRVQSVEPRRVKVEVNGESVDLQIDPFASSRVRLER